MKNELDKLKTTKKNYIICNYHTTNDRGVHWISLYKDREAHTIDEKDKYYFDSYGIQPFQEAIDFLGPHYIYSTFQIQKPNQTCCGTLSLYFLYCLHNGKNYYDTVLDMVKFSYL